VAGGTKFWLPKVLFFPARKKAGVKCKGKKPLLCQKGGGREKRATALRPVKLRKTGLKRRGRGGEGEMASTSKLGKGFTLGSKKRGTRGGAYERKVSSCNTGEKPTPPMAM